MSETSPNRWEILLSHSSPRNLHRCLRVSFRGREVRLCSRCAGLYPALALGLVASFERGLLGVPTTPSWVDPALGVFFPVLGGVAWAVEHWGAPVRKAVRVASGVFLGVGVGWVLGRHVRDPYPVELFHLTLALGIVVVVGVLGRLFRVVGLAEELRADVEAERKKTDDAGENEVDPRAS